MFSAAYAAGALTLLTAAVTLHALRSTLYAFASDPVYLLGLLANG